MDSGLFPIGMVLIRLPYVLSMLPLRLLLLAPWQVATRVFQATVSGRRGAVPVAQPPRGYVNTGSQGCALWPQQQPQPQQVPEEEGKQQRAADELRLQSAGACAAVAVYFEQVRFAHFCITTTQGDHPASVKDAAISGEDWARTVPAVRLLVRLLPEMGTRGAVGRLPGMWTRLVAAVTPRLLEPEVLEEDAMGLLADAGLLLRLQIDWRGNLLPLAPLQPMPVAADTAAAQPFGHCPSLSLRLALEAGLLPALERLLRAAFVEQPAAAGGGQAARQEVLERRARIATCAVGCLLLTSGVFPALLAHAPVAELVPLLATLARVLRRLAAAGDALLLQELPLFGSVVPTSATSKLPPVHLWVQLLTALAQQVRVLSEWEASAPPRPQPPAIHLWVDSFRVDVRWLAAAGGAPPPGSAAAAQQRQMQSLMCLWWAPSLVPWHSACFSDTLHLRANVGAILFMELEHALEAVHLQWRVCRARAHALLGHIAAREAAHRAGSSSGDGGGTGDSSGRRAGASADGSRTASQAVASAAVHYMEAAKEEWRLHSASDSQLHVRRLCEAAAKLLASKAVLAAKEAEAREEAERGGASSGASASSAAADSAAGAGIATESSGCGHSGGGFRRPTVGELLASTGTALLDLIEQDMLCAALAWREQRGAALGSGGGVAGVGPSAPPAPSLPPPPPPYMLVPVAAWAVLYKYGGLAQRPAMESLLLPLQDEDEEHEGEEEEEQEEEEEEQEEEEEEEHEGEEEEEQEEECAWLCPFLEPAEAASEKVRRPPCQVTVPVPALSFIEQHFIPFLLLHLYTNTHEHGYVDSSTSPVLRAPTTIPCGLRAGDGGAAAGGGGGGVPAVGVRARRAQGGSPGCGSGGGGFATAAAAMWVRWQRPGRPGGTVCRGADGVHPVADGLAAAAGRRCICGPAHRRRSDGGAGGGGGCEWKGGGGGSQQGVLQPGMHEPGGSQRAHCAGLRQDVRALQGGHVLLRRVPAEPLGRRGRGPLAGVPQAGGATCSVKVAVVGSPAGCVS